ncbi:MAG: ORF6N domain-containing protein [Cytophagia bacterium]|nr:MAG: ORF6N domain-containing protein [Cytophagia bacterium]TAG43813.1 MAG: ORF6N domain-containing protein [Cytophagia bacterium]
MDYSILKQQAESKILFIRDKEVMIDADLAEMYGVPTGELNRRIKKNPQRFPNDLYVFELTNEEKNQVIAQYQHLEKLKFSAHNPKVFTEYGVIMASTILDSDVAIQVCHIIVDTFIQLRKSQKTVEELKSEVEHLRNTIDEQAQQYASHFQVVFREIQKLKEQVEIKNDSQTVGFVLKDKNEIISNESHTEYQ